MSQSINPHSNWLYKVLDALPPEKPIVSPEHGGWESITLPAGTEGLSIR